MLLGLTGFTPFSMLDITAKSFAPGKAANAGTATKASLVNPQAILMPMLPRLFANAVMFFWSTGFMSLSSLDILLIENAASNAKGAPNPIQANLPSPFATLLANRVKVMPNDIALAGSILPKPFIADAT